MTENRQLREAQLRTGAVFAAPTEDRAPLHFGSPEREYLAAISSAALFDFSERDSIELTGKDRVRFLHSFCTNDIKRLSTGQGCEAFVTNVKGRILGHGWVDAGPQNLWLDVDGGSAARLVAHLERYVINEDVAVADRSADWGTLLALGPQAADGLKAVGLDVTRLANLEHVSCEFWGAAIRVRRFDVGAIPGYALFVDRQQLGPNWDRLCERGLQPAGGDVWRALRIEAGLPEYGVDITDENLAQEAGRTATAISFTKGCYLGQEPIARIDAIGHVNRELRSLRLEGTTIPAPGAPILSGAAATQPLGTVTSSAFSFTHHGPVAMALLRSSASSPGSRVLVEADGQQQPATVFWQPL